MRDDEITAFRSNADWQLAVRLRDLDDRGKVPGAGVPGLDEYRGELIQAVGETLGQAPWRLQQACGKQLRRTGPVRSSRRRGWGLEIVDRLAVRWGTERPDGYRVS